MVEGTLEQGSFSPKVLVDATGHALAKRTDRRYTPLQRMRYVCLGLALLFVSGGCRTGEAAALKTLLESAVHKNQGFGGGIVRIESREDGVLWEGASGSRGDGEPIRIEDTFEIASVTKTFTAVCVMRLVEEGRLELDAPIGSLLPAAVTRRSLVVASHDYGPTITVKQLLNHTSGLPDYWEDPPKSEEGDNAFVTAFLADPSRFWRPREVLAYARKLPAIALPGERYHYSDTGYVLLGLILERVTGKSLQDVYRELLLAPLSMQDTYFSYREQPPRDRYESHRYEKSLDLHGQRRQSAEWAGGGLVSSARDLSRFILALGGDEIFRSPNTLKEMQAWTATDTTGVDYGLGLFRVVLGKGKGELWGHDGHGNAFMYYWPEQRIALVGTLNQTENDWWDAIGPAVDKLCESRFHCSEPQRETRR